ncbi:LuxR C-terminal-related transcriptional regulator [Nonomuraea sp. KM88]|uniref:LuxR C-terminal-related transcriptional regulator n=1 Tax=Nonomuraea sp. KM88 TaxID=3457427 RepID=UPI003FCE80B2
MPGPAQQRPYLMRVMTPTFPEGTDTAPINVAILVGSELLHRGLETVLRQVPMVNLTVDGDACDVLITTEALPGTRENDVKTILLLDEAQVTRPEFTLSSQFDGYLIQEEITANHLRDALHRVVAGELAIPDRLARELLTRASGPPSAADAPQRRPPVSLTARESVTLSLLADGLSNRQIARRLSISEHGAKRLVASVLLKLDSPNRTAAVVTAIKARLIEYA